MLVFLMTERFLIAKLIVQLTSVLLNGALIVANILKSRKSTHPDPDKNSPPKKSPSSQIIQALCFSDFLSSFFGMIASFTMLTFPAKILVLSLLQSTHWSFQITSFCWVGSLALYITHHQRSNFRIRTCHLIIWLLQLSFFTLQIRTVLTDDPELNRTSTIIWGSIAVVNFCIVFLCWIMYTKRWRQKKTSIVMGNLLLYTVFFLLMVSPSTYVRLALVTDSRSYTDMTMHIILQMWPGTNALIAMGKLRFCIPLICERDYSSEDSDNRLFMSPTSHTLKGLVIHEKIGQGIAVVYSGTYRGAKVAVKMKTLLLESDKDLIEFQNACNLEMQKEAQMMRYLSHPNIVLFMDVGFYGMSICIVSEYCARGSLHDVLRTKKGKRLSWPTKIRLALGIAHGIQYLHNANPAMIHRDLKSPNVLVDDSWHAKIADFGTLRFSEIVHSLQMHRQSLTADVSAANMTGLVGTTRWMAPEMICGARIYTRKVDMYSFGLILWELIDGNLPFQNVKWNHEIENMVLKGLRPFLPNELCSNQYKLLILACWQADPENRPNIKQAIQALQRIAREDIQSEQSSWGMDTHFHYALLDQSAMCQSIQSSVSSVKSPPNVMEGKRMMEKKLSASYLSFSDLL